MPGKPIAFLSYVRADDAHEEGRISAFRARLSGEVRLHTGEPFEIFQDHLHIHWGPDWKKRIRESVASVTFLIPILTPGFFRSRPCRDEVEWFLAREQELGRDDLILPLHYINCPVLTDADKRATDELAEVLATRQIVDWREFRHEPLTSTAASRRMAELAEQIDAALERNRPAPAVAPAVPARPATPSVGAEKSVSAPEQAPAARMPPTPKTEPPTLVVDALHRGDHTTLTAALTKAAPGTRILVRPGHYREGITIDKPVEIVGDGARDDIVIEANGKDVVLFRATMGRIANLTLRQAGGGDWYGVAIAQGNLHLEDCDITSQSLACVAIHGDADPRLRRNRIHDGEQPGVLVYENGRGTLEDNDIFGNAHAGIEISQGGNPTVRRNRIHDGRSVGVFVYQNGRGTLEDNDIFGNAGGGVVTRQGGNPTVRRNRITKNGYAAVWVYNGGLGTYEDNDLRGNTGVAWFVEPDCLDKIVRKGNQE
jgi:F-box protein 11